MFYFLFALYLLACLVMIIAVLLHESKGGGLATAFGGAGAESAFGASIGRKINRFTAGAVAVFFILSLVLGVWWSKRTLTPGVGQQPAATQQAPAGGAEGAPAGSGEPAGPGGAAPGDEGKTAPS